MGNKSSNRNSKIKSKISLTDLINYTIESISMIEPYVDSVDYEGLYSIDGVLLFYLKGTENKNETETEYLFRGFFDYKYHQNNVKTRVIQTSETTSININTLKNRKITKFEKISPKKKSCFTKYYYQVTLDNKEIYNLYLNRYKIELLE